MYTRKDLAVLWDTLSNDKKANIAMKYLMGKKILLPMGDKEVECIVVKVNKIGLLTAEFGNQHNIQEMIEANVVGNNLNSRSTIPFEILINAWYDEVTDIFGDEEDMNSIEIDFDDVNDEEE